MGRPSAKERKPYDLDAIVDIAVRVFCDAGTTARRSTRSRARRESPRRASTITSSKEELLARGVGRALDALFAVLDERPGQARARRDRSPEVRRASHDRNHRRALARSRAAAACARQHADRALDPRATASLRPSGRGRYAQAQRQRDLRADIEPRLATRLLFGMLNSITEWYRPGGRAGRRRTCRGDANSFRRSRVDASGARQRRSERCLT